MSAAMKRKIDDEGRVFNSEWYLVIVSCCITTSILVTSILLSHITKVLSASSAEI